MKLSKVSKKINILKGDIRGLQERIENSMRKIDGNEFPESVPVLHESLRKKIESLITLKNARMKANVDHDIYEVILRLGETKSYLHWLEQLDVSSGKSRGRLYDDEKTIAYQSQMTVVERQALIDTQKEMIEGMVDRLDEFNAETKIEV